MRIYLKQGTLCYSLLVAVVLSGLTACATKIDHSFSFYGLGDSPDAEVLDYQYGSSKYPGTFADRNKVAAGQIFTQWGISGVIPRGDFLYVKWRIKDPDKPGEYSGYYEDKVDLKKRLPKDMNGYRIHFLIKGPQLYVYLISPGMKDSREPVGPIKAYRYQKQTQIYPDLPE